MALSSYHILLYYSWSADLFTISKWLLVSFLAAAVLTYSTYVQYQEVLQFDKRNEVLQNNFWLIGIGYGQMMATMFVTSYYASIVAVVIRYFVASFYPTLPWSHCRDEWGPACYDSASRLEPGEEAVPNNGTSSAEFFFM